MHKAPATVGSEGQMYAAFFPQVERLFLHFKLVMPRLQWSNHTVAPRPALNYERRDNYEEGLGPPGLGNQPYI